MGQAVCFLLFAATIGIFAQYPPYTHFPPEMAQIKLSFVHAGAHVQECRRRTAEELAKLPENMRKAIVCDRERLPLAVELALDGQVIYRATLPPSGLSKDGPARAYERFVVPPGKHEIVARLRDTARTEGFDYESQTTVELSPSQNLAIDFRSGAGGFVFR
ncbi:MAG: hypothetical protein ACOY3L_03950 [Pseudomonadota bacterium]